jgi:hypothetical protein
MSALGPRGVSITRASPKAKVSKKNKKSKSEESTNMDVEEAITTKYVRGLAGIMAGVKFEPEVEEAEPAPAPVINTQSEPTNTPTSKKKKNKKR